MNRYIYENVYDGNMKHRYTQNNIMSLFQNEKHSQKQCMIVYCSHFAECELTA